MYHGGAMSRVADLVSGVPQGGNLQPLLFPMFITDILCDLQGLRRSAAATLTQPFQRKDTLPQGRSVARYLQLQ